MFQLKLFGAPALLGPNGPLGGRATQRRRMALLAVLALARSGTVTRDRLLGLLWPEADAGRVRHLLSDSVYLLRKALGEQAILSVGDDLRLDPQRVRCDVVEFEAALEAGEWVRAVELYAGSFLEGFFPEEAPEFERWMDAERERLARGYAHALEARAEAASARGEWQQAVEALRRLSAQDPYSARVALALMRALEAGGDRAEAIRHAHLHARRLRTELEAEPDPQVEALAARLRCEQVPCAPARQFEAAGALPAPAAPPPTGETLAETPQGAGGAGPTHEAAEDVMAGTMPGSGTGARREPPIRRVRALRPRLRHLVLGSVLVLGLLGSLAAGEQQLRLLGAIGFSAGGVLPGAEAASVEIRGERSVAVLPFTDLSSEEANGYFSDGFTEEVIATLATIGDLRVPVARELGVAHVLEGSIRQVGDRVRITAQLVDARSDAHLWAQSYERELSAETFFQIQADIALQIAGALRANISSAERERLLRLPTADLAAYDLYLRGREARKSHALADLRLSVSLFERALQLDPRFALAEAYRGESYGYLWRYTRQPEYRDSAYASHQRALRMAPELPEGHQLLARHYDSVGRRSEALSLYHRALELNPNHPGSLHDLAVIHQRQGELDRALPYAKKAAAVEPTSFLYSWGVFMLYVRLGDFAAAEHWLGQVLALETTRLREHHGRVVLSLVRGQPEQVRQHLEAIRQHEGEEPSRMVAAADYALYSGDLEAARREYERLRATFPERFESVLTGRAYIHWKAGELQSAQALLEQAIQHAHRQLDRGDESADPHVTLARAHAIRGEADRALESLETAYMRGWRGYHTFARLDPRFQNLRGHPRFERLMATVRADLARMLAKVREQQQP